MLSPATHLPEDVIPACTQRPDDWFPETPAELELRPAAGAVTACLQCPLRRGCARVALDDAKRVYGIWAGVYVPLATSPTHAGQRRTGLRTLQNLAEYTR